VGGNGKKKFIKKKEQKKLGKYPKKKSRRGDGLYKMRLKWRPASGKVAAQMRKGGKFETHRRIELARRNIHKR